MTSIVSDEEQANFEAEQDFDIPRRAEETSDNSKDADTTDDSDESDESKEESDDSEEDAILSGPVLSVEDPGEFTPQDYGFEVVTYDQEGNKPKVVKINSVDEWDKLLNDDPNFGSGAALLKAERQATKMEQSIERDKKEHDDKKKTYQDAKKKYDNQVVALNTMESEINYLEEEGYLPPIEDKYKNADWSDKEVAKQPGVKERLTLLNYMARKNSSRAKKGLRPFSSVLDAHASYELDQTRKKAEDTKKTDGEARKTAGARVASGAPSAMNAPPAGLSVGRGGSLDDL